MSLKTIGASFKFKAPKVKPLTPEEVDAIRASAELEIMRAFRNAFLGFRAGARDESTLNNIRYGLFGLRSRMKERGKR